MRHTDHIGVINGQMGALLLRIDELETELQVANNELELARARALGWFNELQAERHMNQEYRLALTVRPA